MQYSPYIRQVPGAHTAVVMIHGICGTPAHFRNLVHRVPENYALYNILLDGHGGTVRDFAKTSMEKWKAQVSGLLDQLLEEHQRILLVGHSMGTLLSIGEAIKRPGQIAGLFLLAVPLTPIVPVSTAWSSLLLSLGLAKPGSTAEKMSRDSSIRLTKFLPQYLTWIPRGWELLVECDAIRRKLPLLQTPAVCFQSKNDELVSRRSCSHLRKNPNIALRELQNSGHFAYSKKDMHCIQKAFRRFLAE